MSQSREELWNETRLPQVTEEASQWKKQQKCFLHQAAWVEAENRLNHCSRPQPVGPCERHAVLHWAWSISHKSTTSAILRRQLLHASAWAKLAVMKASWDMLKLLSLKVEVLLSPHALRWTPLVDFEIFLFFPLHKNIIPLVDAEQIHVFSTIVRHHLTMQWIPFACSTVGARTDPEVLQCVVTLVQSACNKICAVSEQSTAMFCCDRLGSVKFEHHQSAFSNIQVVSSKRQVEFTNSLFFFLFSPFQDRCLHACTRTN